MSEGMLVVEPNRNTIQFCNSTALNFLKSGFQRTEQKSPDADDKPQEEPPTLR